MSYSNIHPIQSFYAKEALPTQGIAVKLDTDELTVTKATAATDEVVGLVFNPVYTAGDSVGILTAPGVKASALAGAAVAIGDLLGVDSSGRLVKAATNALYFAKALSAATAADQYITVLTGVTGKVTA